MQARLWICVGLLLVLEAATVTAYCGLIFGCGCTFLDGMAYCNVHNLQGPWCPWCSQGKLGFYVPFAVMTGGADRRRLVGAPATVPASGPDCWRERRVTCRSGAVAAWVSARLQGYPL